MKHQPPLGHQGHLAARFRKYDLDNQAEQAVALAIRQSVDPAPHHPNTYDPADALLLRGIPCIANGVGGTSPGTRPDKIAC